MDCLQTWNCPSDSADTQLASLAVTHEAIEVSLLCDGHLCSKYAPCSHVTLEYLRRVKIHLDRLRTVNGTSYCLLYY